jgi:hypothetical protein
MLFREFICTESHFDVYFSEVMVWYLSPGRTIMKPILLLTIIACLSLYHPAQCQIRTVETRTSVDSSAGDTTVSKSVIVSTSEDITPRSSMLVVNPLKFFLFYNLSYFHRLSSGVAIGFGVQSPTLSDIEGFGVNAEVRVYPSGKSLRGFYVAPNFSYNHLTSADATTSPTSFGVLLGWQWFPGDEFALGLGLGIDYYSGSVSENGSELDPYNGTAPALRFDIGYAW